MIRRVRRRLPRRQYPEPPMVTAYWWLSSRMIGAYSLLLGVGIAVGGPMRMPPPTYDAILEWAAPWVWGWALVVGVLLAWLLPTRPSQWACRAVAAWFVLFGCAFFVAFLQQDAAPFTSWWTYLAVAAQWLIMATVRIVPDQGPADDQ